MKKNHTLLFVCSGIFFGIGITLLVLSNFNFKELITETKPSASKEITYICEKKMEEKENYIIYYLEEVIVKDNIIKKVIPTIELRCTSEEIFKELESNKDFSENRSFNDKTLTITSPNGEEIVYGTGEFDFEVLYSDYVVSIGENDYTCTEK